MSVSTLAIDLYELTMAASFLDAKMVNRYATFDLFVRRLPKNRTFFIAAGLSKVLEYLENFSFGKEEIDFLKSKRIFKDNFLDYLKGLKFTGDVMALKEGTVFFPQEPVLRISAPIVEAQLLESYLLSTINIATTIATKSSRVVTAASGRDIYDFSLRRTQGPQAGLVAARSSFIAGCAGTSNVLADFLYGIPSSGTMAHSFILTFKSEVDSFRAYVSTFPNSSTLLVDTYDYRKGIENAIKVAKELEEKGHRLKAVRLDSGNLVSASRYARLTLDKAGLNYVKIIASGNLDEFKIDNLLKKGALIDSFGVGTNMGVSSDAPYLDVIYKLCEIVDEEKIVHPVMKLSQDKMTYPGKKQVFRIRDKKGNYAYDILALESEENSGEPLLVKVVEKGEVIYKRPALSEIKSSVLDNLKYLPLRYKALRNKSRYPVVLSLGLKKMIFELKNKILTRD